MSATAQNAPFSELYSAYAAGCLDPAFALLVETQAALREDVRNSIKISEAIAGVQLESEEPADMQADAVARALAVIDEIETSAPQFQRAALEAASDGLTELLTLPEPLRDSALDAAGEAGWSRVSPGLQRLKLNVSEDMETELYRIDAGTSVPRHTHAGSELTLVVSGGFTDETGQFGPGDLSLKGPDDTHTPTADDDGPCLVLAVRDGGLRFTGLMGLIQRLTG